MAIRVPIISDFDEAGINKALMGFKKLSYDIKAADGAMAKFKVAGSAAFDVVKKNAVAFGAAAAAAVTAFVGKAIGDFVRLGLAVDKFSQATGTTTEQASRLIEVMSDMDIESNSLQTALNKLNRAAADGAEGFKLIGAEIARTSSGAVDVQKTFFNVIDALRGIQDPALRAKAATQLLGRGWMELSRLVGEGSGKLKTALESVSATKVLTKEDTQRAKDFQAAMEDLKDVAEDFAINVARNLLPVLKKAIEFLSQLGEVMGTATFTADDLNKYLGRNVLVTEQMAAAWRDGYAAMIDGNMAANGLTGEMLDLTEATEAAKDEWNRLKGVLSLEYEMLTIQQNIDAFYAKWTQAMADGTFDAIEYQKELINIQIALLDIGSATDGLKGKLRDKFKFLVDTGQLERALSLINAIKRGLRELKNPSGPGSGDEVLMSKIPAMAAGGIVTGPTVALIGEAGPEAVIPLDRLNTMGNITINVSGSVVTENDLIESIRKGLANSQRNGAQLVYSNT